MDGDGLHSGVDDCFDKSKNTGLNLSTGSPKDSSISRGHNRGLRICYMSRGRQPATEMFNILIWTKRWALTNGLLQLVTLRSRTRARETWTNARALKPAGYTKTT